MHSSVDFQNHPPRFPEGGSARIQEAHMATKATYTIKPLTLTLALVSAVAMGGNSAFAADELTGWKDYSHFAQYQTSGVMASSSGNKLSFEGTGAAGSSTFADNQKEYALSSDIKITFDLELKAKALTPDPSENKTRAGISLLLVKGFSPSTLEIDDGVEIAFFQEAPKSSNRHLSLVEYDENVKTSKFKRSISNGNVSVEVHYKSGSDKIVVSVDGEVLGEYKGLDKLKGNKWISPWFRGWQNGANTWDDISIKKVKIESSTSRPIGGEVTTRESVFQRTGPEKVVWFGNSTAFVEAPSPAVFDRLLVGGPKFSDGVTGPQVIRRQGLARLYEYDGVKLFTITGLDVPCLIPPPPLGIPNPDQMRAALLGWSVADAKSFGAAGAHHIAIGAPGWSNKRGGVFIFDQNGLGQFCIQGINVAGDTTSRFGWSVHCPGDLNNDGIDDLIVGAPTHDTFQGENSGTVYVISGDIDYDPVDNPNPEVTILFKKSGESPGAQMGYSVGQCTTTGLSPKVLVGAPYETIGNYPEAGAAYVFEYDIPSESATRITKLEGEGRGDWFGFSLASAGDFNNDGQGDIVVGAPNMNDSKGGAYVYSVVDEQRLFKAKGHQKGGNMGWAVAGNIDLLMDGYSDIAVSTPGSDDTFNRQGSAAVYLGASGALLTTVHGRHKKDQLGSSLGLTMNSPYGDGAMATGTYRYLRNNKTGAAYLNIINE